MTERLSTSHIVVVIDILMSTFEAMLSVVTIGDSVSDEDRVITKTIRGMFVLSGSSGSFILLKLEPIFIMNKVFMFCKNFVVTNVIVIFKN